MAQDEVAEYYDQIAPHYAKQRFRKTYCRGIDKLERKFVLAGVGTEAKVLEIGPGTGRFTRELLRKGASVTAVDVSRGMLDQLRKGIDSPRLKLKRLHVKDLEKVEGFGDFDCVVCMRVLPHLEDPMQALGLMRRALRQDGCAIFDLWNSRSFVGLRRKLLRRKGVLTRFYRYAEMREMIASSGFRMGRVWTWGFPRLGPLSLDRVGDALMKRFAYSILFEAQPVENDE